LCDKLGVNLKDLVTTTSYDEILKFSVKLLSKICTTTPLTDTSQRGRLKTRKRKTQDWKTQD